MTRNRGDLAELGSCEGEIEALERELARLPVQIGQAMERSRDARDAIARLREDLLVLERARRQKEAEIQDWEARRQKLHGQTALVKTNVEYTAILREIDAAAQQIAQIEDEVLGLFEAVDERARDLALREKELEEQAAGFDAEARILEERRAELERACAGQRARREGLVAALGAEARVLYDRAVRSRGSGVVIVRAGSCSGCHRAIPPQVINLVLSGEIGICENCRRILVVPEG